MFKLFQLRSRCTQTPLQFRHVETCFTWTFRYRSFPNKFKFVHYVICTIGKWAAGIQMDCLLVFRSFCIVMKKKSISWLVCCPSNDDLEFPRRVGGRQPMRLEIKTYYLTIFLPKTAWKWKKLDRGVGAFLVPHLDPPMLSFAMIVEIIISLHVWKWPFLQPVVIKI